MKKLIIAIAILFGTFNIASAQDQGLFERGFLYNDQNEQETGTGAIGLHLPSSHGVSGDSDANSNLGSGVAVLLGLGAAYAIKKKHREE